MRSLLRPLIFATISRYGQFAILQLPNYDVMPKTFIVSDESVNRYGGRILTSGIDTSEFERNPIGFYNHLRTGEGWYERDWGIPFIKWENIRKENGQLLMDLVIDDEDPRGKDLKRKVEQGFLNTASIGIEVVARSEDPSLMLIGQTRATITQCKLQEVSVVDIPGNANAVALYNKGNIIQLHRASEEEIDKVYPKIKNKSLNNKSSNMKLLFEYLDLSSDASEHDVLGAIKKLQDKGEDKVTELKLALKQKDIEIDKLKDAAQKEKSIALVDAALQAGKITKDEVEDWQELALAKYDKTKKILDAKQAYKPIGQQLKLGGNGGVKSDAELYDELDKANKLVELKAREPERFMQLLNAKHASLPKK